MSAPAARFVPRPVHRFRVGQIWAPRRIAQSGCKNWTIVAISQHPNCPVIAQSDCGSVREFDYRGFFGGSEENEPSDLDLVTLLRNVEDVPDPIIAAIDAAEKAVNAASDPGKHLLALMFGLSAIVEARKAKGLMVSVGDGPMQFVTLSIVE